jgi:predicted RNA polymerase sigma factor
MGKGAVKALDELRKAQKNLCDLQYYLYPAVAAEIHLQLGDKREARSHYASALRLAGNKAEKAFLAWRLRELDE